LAKATINLCAVVVVIFSFISLVSANQDQQDCESSQTQLELNACWSQLAGEIEGKVKTAYLEIVRALEQAGEKNALKLLKRAQRYWEQYRDVQCEGARQLYEGGSVAKTVEATCRAKTGRNRIGDLDVTYSDRLQK
jgi:uncharacterized protein YecT (DUF1311 family)